MASGGSQAVSMAPQTRAGCRLGGHCQDGMSGDAGGSRERTTQEGGRHQLSNAPLAYPGQDETRIRFGHDSRAHRTRSASPLPALADTKHGLRHRPGQELARLPRCGPRGRARGCPGTWQLEECSSWIILERVRKRGTTTAWLHANGIPTDILTADHHKVYHKLWYEHGDKTTARGGKWRYWRKKHEPAPRSPPELHSDIDLGGAAAELPFSYNAGQFAFNHAYQDHLPSG
eukprot:316493-Rhodomonas_salina.1